MSFKHPEFLYALFAILIPVIIHLFNFRRYKKLWFSNIQFLKNITTETRKQNKLKHLIVLILRIFAIIFIVLAFSGPEWRKEDSISLSSAAPAAFYIDNSFSMMSEGSKGRLFEESLKQARNLVNQMPRDKQLLLLTNKSSTGRRLLSKEAFIAELNSINISPESRKISSVIRTLRKTREEKVFKESEMYLLSDFQDNAFDEENIPEDTLGIYYFLPQQLRQRRNIYLDSCWISAPVVLPGRPVELMIKLFNASETDLDKIPLKVLVNGQQKAVAGVDLKSGSAEIITVNFTVYENGWHTGFVEIDDHPIIFDDRLYFAFAVQRQINVLEINDINNDDFLRSFYETEPLFNFQTMDYRQVDYNRFRDYNLIILNGLPNMSTGLISQIKDFAASGKNVFFIPGTEIKPEKINDFLSAINAGKVTILDTASTRVVRINKQSELFSDAVSKVPENADLPDVFTHFKYRYPISSGLESLISLLNGDDLLLKKNYGKGLVYLLAVPLDKNYSNFMSNALFVPVMYNAAVQGKSTNRLFYTIGEDNKIETENVYSLMSESPFTLIHKESDFALIPEQKVANGKLILDLHNGIQEAGIYNLALNDTIYQVSAFNFNRNESQMDFLDDDLLEEKLLASGLMHFKIVNSAENNIAAVVKSLQKENELWKLFIIFALLMLLAEVLILRFWK